MRLLSDSAPYGCTAMHRLALAPGMGEPAALVSSRLRPQDQLRQRRSPLL